MCRKPRPKVVQVPLNGTKSYIPHCTILHRCGADTGCCKDDSEVCAMKESEAVDLYFIVSVPGRMDRYEKLSFVNHTECHCINRPTSEEDPRPPSNLKECKCPKEFAPMRGREASCDCDCSSEDNSECQVLKRGEGWFSIEDRL